MSNRQVSRPIHAGVIAAAAALLAACGGGESGGERQQAAAITAATTAATLDAGSLFGWAEKVYPSLFPAGPQNQPLVYDGKTYTIRYYPGTSNYLGESGGLVYGYGAFTGNALQGFGKVNDYTCLVAPDSCPPFTISGTAARGSALAGAAVLARCAIGGASTVTAADGSYSLAITGGQLPCALRVTAGDGSVMLHSLAGTGDGGSIAKAVAQITPLTELTLASATALPAATWFHDFEAGNATAPSSQQLILAGSSVTGVLASARIDTAAIGSPFTAPLVAASGGGSGGNAYDQALDKLGRQLASAGSTLGQLSTAMSTRAANPTTASDTALPGAEALLAPATADCAAFRSGTYRIVLPGPAATGMTFKLRIDATASTSTFIVEGQAEETVAFSSLGNCRFKGQAGDEWVVSAAGVMVGKVDGGSGSHLFIGFPEQASSLNDLSGSWNTLGMDGDAKPLSDYTFTVANGRLTSAFGCRMGGTCKAVTDLSGTGTFTVNAKGGFNATYGDGTVDRYFTYRSGSGALMIVGLWSDGGMEVWTPVRNRDLPAAGDVRKTYELSVSPSFQATTAISTLDQTVLSVKPAEKSWLRQQPGTGSATYNTTLLADSPRTGYTFRAAGATTDSTGAAVNFTEFTALNVVGMNFTVFGRPAASGQGTASNLYGFSVIRP